MTFTFYSQTVICYERLLLSYPQTLVLKG